MTYRTRIYYSDAQKQTMWDRWQRGESLKSIGRAFNRGSSSIYGVLSRTGGIRPPTRSRSRLALTLSEREEISRGIASDLIIACDCFATWTCTFDDEPRSKTSWRVRSLPCQRC